MNNKSYWGYHLVMDLKGCKTDVKDREIVNKFMIDLVDVIDMKRYGDPIIVKFGESPAVSGFSAIQLIETSNLTGHMVDITNDIYFDIFSCKAYSPEVALEFARETWRPNSTGFTFMCRQAGQVPEIVKQGIFH